jgi:hypothetical protein
MQKFLLLYMSPVSAEEQMGKAKKELSEEDMYITDYGLLYDPSRKYGSSTRTNEKATASYHRRRKIGRGFRSTCNAWNVITYQKQISSK